ncbi:MAG: hypothetical protein V3R66_08440 [Rhodospirillales bacterium]
MFVLFVIAFKTTSVREINWSNLFFNRNIEARQFEIDNVALGMTPANVKRLHSNLSLIIDENGGAKGSYTSNGALYSVWFLGSDEREKAYRLRYDQVFRTIGETEILNRINRKYGQPATSDCFHSSAISANKCHFKWWPNGGVSMDVFIATITDPSGQVRTEVSMVAADVTLEGKRFRAQAAKRRIASQFHLKTADDPPKTPEILPF